MHLHLMPYAAYNVFQRKRQPALRCAVRQDRPVPAFIQSEAWVFCCTTTVEQPSPGFQPEAAAKAMRFTGYYFFKALDDRRAESVSHTPAQSKAAGGRQGR